MKAQAITAALPIDKRRGARARLLLTASMRTEAGEEVAYILNLSREGAKLDADAPPPEGARLTLVRGALAVAGTVAWVDKHRFGVRFDAPIDDALLAEHLAAARALTQAH